MSTGSSLSTQSGLDAELAAFVAKDQSIPATPDSKAAPPEFTDQDALEGDWDEQYESIQTLLAELKMVSGRSLPHPGGSNWPLARHDLVTATTETGSVRTHWPNWLVISLGMMLFVCGVVLIVWSFAGREELWRAGLPIALVGQALLVVGGALQLETLRLSSRQTTDELQRIANDLAHLQQSTKLCTPTRSAAAQSFYAHRAENASPHIMLADLKGQLDAIALRLSRREEPE